MSDDTDGKSSNIAAESAAAKGADAAASDDPSFSQSSSLGDNEGAMAVSGSSDPPDGSVPVPSGVGGDDGAAKDGSRDGEAEDDGFDDSGDVGDGGEEPKGRLPFGGVNWRKEIKKNACCRDTEQILKPIYEEQGGTQGTLGDAGLDGQATTLSLHAMLEKLVKAGAITKGGGTSVMDLGSGCGGALAHIAHFLEGAGVGIEMDILRVQISLAGLRKMIKSVRLALSNAAHRPSVRSSALLSFAHRVCG